VSDLAEAGVSRSRFAAAGGTGEEEGTAGFGQRSLEGGFDFGRELELVHEREAILAGEETHDGAFAMQGGEGADAHFGGGGVSGEWLSR